MIVGHQWAVFKDYDGALPLYQQAIASPDPGVAAEALTGLGQAHRAHGYYQAARDVLEEAIATGHPDWAPQAMIMLEYQLCDYDEAQVVFHRWAPYALVVIGRVLKDRGDTGGWRDAWHLPGNETQALTWILLTSLTPDLLPAREEVFGFADEKSA